MITTLREWTTLVFVEEMFLEAMHPPDHGPQLRRPDLGYYDGRGEEWTTTPSPPLKIGGLVS